MEQVVQTVALVNIAVTVVYQMDLVNSVMKVTGVRFAKIHVT